MIDTQFTTLYPTGSDLYSFFLDATGKIYNGTSFVDFVLADRLTYPVLTQESQSGSGIYVSQFPTSSPAGFYYAVAYLQSGDDPEATDLVISQSPTVYWDGTTFGGSPGISGGVKLAPDGLDDVILEPAEGGKPAINARVGLALVFDSAPGGVITGVNTTDPIKVYNPSGSVLRMTITADPVGNRTNAEINNVPE